MKIFAVIDTNVLVSALFTHNSASATTQIIEYISKDSLIPLYNADILAEYSEVLSRPKFHILENEISDLMDLIISKGSNGNRQFYSGVMTDEDDRVFYEVSLSKEGSYLVTGNIKHFPKTPLVVTPAEMIAIIESIHRDEFEYSL